ncbi:MULTISPECIES: hypothetical protein [Citricoccus]|uniref:hypothetical protein n=1 Tax=Citricoccus TaxID=169133 RepID=UPI000255E123|nr:hypothetical protein [Citricoccus sp. CH26A]
MQRNELEAPIAIKILRRLRTATESGRITWSPVEDYVPDRDWLSGRFAVATIEDTVDPGRPGGDAVRTHRFVVDLQLGGPLPEGDEMGPMVEIYTEDDPRCCVITEYHEDAVVLDLLTGLADAVDARDVFPHPSYPMDTEEQRARAVAATFALMDAEDDLHPVDEPDDEARERAGEEWAAEIEALRRDVEHEIPQLRFRSVPEPFDGAVLSRFIQSLDALST